MGFEARVALSRSLAFTFTARGTKIRYVNHFHLDGGHSQHLRFVTGRFDAGLEWTPQTGVTLMLGYSAFDTFINAASKEDTDTFNLEAGGIYAGASLSF